MASKKRQRLPAHAAPPTPFAAAPGTPSSQSAASVAGCAQNSLDLICGKCEEKVSLEDSRPTGKDDSNLLKRVCTSCANFDQQMTRQNRLDPDVKPTFKKLPKEEKINAYKQQKRKREANGGRASYGSNNELKGEIADIDKRSNVWDDVDHMMTFTQFAIEQIQLKNCEDLKGADVLWKVQLARDDRKKVFHRNQWLLEDYQGIDMRNRHEKGVEERLSKRRKIENKDDLADFRANAKIVTEKFDRHQKSNALAGVSSAEAEDVSAFDVDGVVTLESLDVGSAAFENMIIKDMVARQEAEKKQKDEIHEILVAAQATKVTAGAKAKAKAKAKSTDMSLRKMQMQTNVLTTIASLDRMSFLALRKIDIDLKNAEQILTDMGDETIKKSADEKVEKLGEVKQEYMVELANKKTELEAASNKEYADADALTTFEKEIKEFLTQYPKDAPNNLSPDLEQGGGVPAELAPHIPTQVLRLFKL